MKSNCKAPYELYEERNQRLIVVLGNGEEATGRTRESALALAKRMAEGRVEHLKWRVVK